jgi:hypothetical protein
MKKKVYLIKKLCTTDGLIETNTEVYATEKERDDAFLSLIDTHNEMIRDAYCDDGNEELDKEEFHYEWDNDHLEFWNKHDPEMHTDYYDKDEDEIEIKDKVYVVHIDSYSGEGSSIDAFKVFSTREKAREHLKKCRDDFEGEDLDYYDPEDYIIEDDEDSYTWYIDGQYDQDHYCISIHELEVE